jgi:hypothetical protein
MSCNTKELGRYSHLMRGPLKLAGSVPHTEFNEDSITGADLNLYTP